MGNVDSALEAIEPKDMERDHFEDYVYEERVNRIVEDGGHLVDLDQMIRDSQVFPSPESVNAAFDNGKYKTVFYLMQEHDIYPEHIIHGTERFQDSTLRAEALEFLAENVPNATLFSEHPEIIYHGIAVHGALNGKIESLMWAQSMGVSLNGIIDIVLSRLGEEEFLYSKELYVEIIGWLILNTESLHIDVDTLQSIDSRLSDAWNYKNL